MIVFSFLCNYKSSQFLQCTCFTSIEEEEGKNRPVPEMNRSGGQKRHSGQKSLLEPWLHPIWEEHLLTGGARLSQAPGPISSPSWPRKERQKGSSTRYGESLSLKPPRAKVMRGPNRDTGNTSKRVHVSRRKVRFSSVNRKIHNLKPMN